MIKLAILGSCVTRDAFALHTESQFEVGFYGAKGSIPSMVAPPVRVTDLAIPVEFDGWRRRQIIRDFAKTTFDDLAAAEFDFLLMDLIEERFSLVAYRGSYVTASDIYSEVETDTIRASAVARPRISVDPGYYDESFDLFCQRLSQAVDPSRIILNRVLFAEHAQSANGDIVDYTGDESRAMNAMLDHGYRKLQAGLPGLRVNDQMQVRRVADPNHRWGFHPFHFTPEFYSDLVANVQRLTS